MRKLGNFVAKIAKNKSKVICALIMGALLFVVLIPLSQVSTSKTIQRFHRIYYATQPYAHTHFLGIVSGQYPTDNWVMQEIITEIKPDFIIETGTGSGGTALFYATILEKVNETGKVITINIAPDLPDPKACEFKTWKERVEFIQDNSVSPKLVRALRHRVKGSKVLVTLDSDHNRVHVLKELQMYSPLVSVGSYIVVQDTHLSGHPNHHPSEGKSGGPWEAVRLFLKRNENFEVDHSREKYLVTQYPSGFLKRIR